MKKTLKSKILLLIVISILFFGTVASLFVFLYTRKSILDIQKENLQKVATEQSHESANLFDNLVSLASTLSKQKEIIEYISNDARLVNDQEVLRILEHYNINDSFLAIYIIDNKGNTLVSTDQSFVGKNYFFRDYFENAIKGHLSVEVALGVTSGELGYYFSSPIFDYSGSISGVVVFKADPEIVNEPLERFSGVDSARVMLVDKFGVVVFSDLKTRMFSTLGELTDDELAYIKKERTYENINFDILDYKIIKDSLPNLKDSEIFDIYDKKHGEHEILSASKIGQYSFYLLVEESADKYSLEAFRPSLVVSVIVLLAAIIAVFLIFFVVTRILDPLKKISEANKEIASGNYKYRLDIKTGDELEELSDSFNDMSSKLKVNVANIEKEVQDRTEKLSKMNNMMIGREKRIAELKKQLNKKK